MNHIDSTEPHFGQIPMYPFARFFLYVYVASFFLIGGYLLCSVYNLLWIVSPRVGRLSSFLHGCHRETDFYETDVKMHELDEERPTVKLNLYFRVSSARRGRVAKKVCPRLRELATKVKRFWPSLYVEEIRSVIPALSEGRQGLSAAPEPARRISGPPRGLPHLVAVRAPVHDAVGSSQHQH